MLSILNVHEKPHFVQVSAGEVTMYLYVFVLLGGPETLE